MTLRHAASAVAALVVGLLPAAPAQAGGTWLSPVRDSYAPGDIVTLVGYTGGSGAGGTPMDGPYFGWLRVDPDEAYRDPPPDQWPFVHPSDLYFGELIVERTDALKGWTMFRLELSYTLPATLADGSYEVVVCNDPCTTGFGDVIGATVYVGVDPPEPLTREWLLDDPAIAQLDDDALVWLPGWPGYSRTAGDIRRGATAPAPAPVDPDAARETAQARLDAETPRPDDDPAATAEPPTTRPDVESAGESGGDSGGARGRAGLYLVGVAAAGAAFLGLRRVGPGRKQVHSGGDSGGSDGSGGQPASGPPRWPGRVVRL